MTTKEFIIGVIITVLIYGFVTHSKENSYIEPYTYSNPQIQVMPYDGSFPAPATPPPPLPAPSSTDGGYYVE